MLKYTVLAYCHFNDLRDAAMHRLTLLRNDRRGVTAMEYGIIAATTVVVVGGVIGTVGGSLGRIWTAIDTALSAAAPAA